MDTCFLHPPTGRVLSDAVIGGVVQRTKSISRSDTIGVRANSYSNASSIEPRWSRYSSNERTQVTTLHYPHDTGRHYDTSTPTVDRKRPRSESDTLMMLAVSSADTTKKSAEEALREVASQDWFIEQQNHQREIRRMRQIRYRKKQQDYMVTLEDDNRQLQQEIQRLQQRRRAIASSIPSEKTLWNVAVEYFRLFRYGLRASDLPKQSSNPQDKNACVQLDFLRSTMAPNVMYNAGRGVGSIMRNWMYFSLWFKDGEVELDGLKKSGDDSLMAKTTTTFTITEKTLVSVFPHLGDSDAGRQLANKLLGQTIVMSGATRFDWDSGFGRVTSVISESDMLTPMLRLLGSLEDVSRVFEKSLISLTPYRGQGVSINR